MTTPRIKEMVEELDKEYGNIIGWYELKSDIKKALTHAHQAGIDEAVKRADMEIYALENTLEKSKELPVAFGHKRVYERLKLISEYKGKLEAWKEIREMLDDTKEALQDNK